MPPQPVSTPIQNLVPQSLGLPGSSVIMPSSSLNLMSPSEDRYSTMEGHSSWAGIAIPQRHGDKGPTYSHPGTYRPPTISGHHPVGFCCALSS